jgi:sigma-B regulation protein RsbU (phosphoserine phosphatase)
MTLFVAELGLRDNVIHWVRAGHDPALVYDPGQDAFSELMGDGLALGLDEAYPYAGNEQALEPGAIVVIGTDGLWEARNAAGEMMDKERLREIIRTHAGEPAQAIVEALMAGQREHLGDLDPEDDVTLVVLKLT